MTRKRVEKAGYLFEVIMDGERCSVCGGDLTREDYQPTDTIRRVVWIAPGIPGTEVLRFCKYCIERRKLGLIRGLKEYADR